MQKNIVKGEPLTKILVPIDVENPSWRVMALVGCLAERLGDRLKGITLFHATGGRYLSEHMLNIDVRAGYVIESGLIKRLREEYIERKIEPVMLSANERIRKWGIKTDVKRETVDGDPVKKILEKIREEGFSTVIMERRDIGTVQEILLGSVTASLLHRDTLASIYMVGNAFTEDTPCAVFKCLIPVDGSPHALSAVEEAAVLGEYLNGSLEEMVLLRVINLAGYPESVSKGLLPEKEAKTHLDEAEELLKSKGIPQSSIKSVLKYGDPVKVIASEAKERGVDLIIMGRRGRSAVKEIFMGSVSSGVLRKCQDPIIAMVTR